MLLVGSLALPADAWADGQLKVLGVDTSGVTQKAYDDEEVGVFSVYLQTGSTEVDKSDLEISFLKSDLSVKEIKPRPFASGDMPIAVVVVFPSTIAYQYDNGKQIRRAVSSFLKGSNDKETLGVRDKDYIGVVGYGSESKSNIYQLELKGEKGKSYSGLIGSMEHIDVTTPNLYDAVSQGALMLSRAKKVKQRYLIVVSDAVGYKGKDRDAQLSSTVNSINDNGITPLVFNFPPGPLSGQEQESILTTLSAGGEYQKVNPGGLDNAFDTALSVIYEHNHIIDVVVDLDKQWVETGEKMLVIKSKSGGDDVKEKLTWPKISKSHWWILWWILITVGGIFLLWGLWVLIRWFRNREPAEPEPVYEDDSYDAPVVDEGVTCDVCGKRIPTDLYGFSGEFCLDGGLADCPYYQPPDRGKLLVTRGELSGATFFIKDEITTIGSLPKESTSVLLRDESVSKKHAAIKADEGKRYELRDFASTNGTWVNGDRIQRKFLKDGDKIGFGKVEVEFHLK